MRQVIWFVFVFKNTTFKNSVYWWNICMSALTNSMIWFCLLLTRLASLWLRLHISCEYTRRLQMHTDKTSLMDEELKTLHYTDIGWEKQKTKQLLYCGLQKTWHLILVCQSSLWTCGINVAYWAKKQNCVSSWHEMLQKIKLLQPLPLNFIGLHLFTVGFKYVNCILSEMRQHFALKQVHSAFS